MSGEKISRRRYLELTAAAIGGLAVGGIVGYSLRKPEVMPPGPAPTHSMVMIIGGYRPDVVRENIAEFDREWGIPMDKRTEVQSLSGDLTVATETKLAAGAPVDICYSYPYATTTWSKAGWILPIDDIKKTDIVPYDISEIKGKLYPVVLEAYTVEGKLYGLPYFVSDYGCILTNEELLAKAGMSDDYPTTWKELYEKVEVLAKKHIVDHPLLPSWYNEPFGIPWAFVLEVINQGGNEAMWAKEYPHGPTFDVGTLAEEVLKDWKNAWDNGWVPKGVLTMKQTDFLGEFATGKYFYQVNAEYYLGYMNDPARSKIAGKCSIVPPKKQPWGLLDSAIYSLVNRKDRKDKDLEFAQALLEFLGYKNRYGQYYVGKRWAILEFLKTMPEVLEDPEVKAIWGAKLYRVEDLDTVNKLLSIVQIPLSWKAPWYTKWNTIAQSELPLALTGQKSIKEVIKTLRDKAEELSKSG